MGGSSPSPLTGHLTVMLRDGTDTSQYSNLATKVNGNNGTGNSSIEVRNNNNTGLIILNASNPSVGAPSIWMEINTSTNQLYFYKDTGSGWGTLGHIDITP